MKQLVIVKPNTLSEGDKKNLTENGFIVIENENPNDVRIVSQVNEIDTHLILMSAMEGLSYSTSAQQHFCQEVHKRLVAREKTQSQRGIM